MYGYRLIGGKTGMRRLVIATAAFAAYAACDPKAEVHREAYLSAFTFGNEFRQHLERTGSTKGYDGPCGADIIWWDVDRSDLEVALTDARRLATVIADPMIFFSGSKGFHLGMRVELEPSPDFNRVAKRFATTVAEQVGVEIDKSVYDKVRAFRAPNSRHAKTGLHKVSLTPDELARPLEEIKAIATAPRPFDPTMRPAAITDA